MAEESEFFTETGGYRVAAKLCEHGEECRITLAPLEETTAPPTLTSEQVAGWLQQQGITHGHLEEALGELKQALADHKPVTDLLIAKAAAPQPGRDAEINFEVSVSSDNPQFKEDASGKVDYRQTNRFRCVQAGQVIARYVPAELGKSGHTVTGLVIPAPPVKQLGLRAGAGVTHNAEAHEFVARIDGAVMQVGDALVVNEKLDIPSDLDFRIGNVDFSGFLVVHGEILDGFQIRADKGIKVSGHVGACTLSSKGPIELNGGITGGAIVCGQKLTARYLHSVQVECEGDVVVHKEVYQAQIKCAGTLRVAGGIVGGECTALKGIEAGVVGTEMNAATQVIAGVDYRFLKRRRELDQLFEATNQRLQHLINLIGPMIKNGTAKRTPMQVERMQQMSAEIEELSNKRKALSQEIKDMTDERSRDANAKLNVMSMLYPGVHILLGQAATVVMEAGKGPLSMICVLMSEVQRLPYSELRVAARDLEAKWLATEHGEAKP